MYWKEQETPSEIGLKLFSFLEFDLFLHIHLPYHMVYLVSLLKCLNACLLPMGQWHPLYYSRILKKWTDLSVYSYLARYTKIIRITGQMYMPGQTQESTYLPTHDCLCRIWRLADNSPRQIIILNQLHKVLETQAVLTLSWIFRAWESMKVCLSKFQAGGYTGEPIYIYMIGKNAGPNQVLISENY